MQSDSVSLVGVPFKGGRRRRSEKKGKKGGRKSRRTQKSEKRGGRKSRRSQKSDKK